VFDIDVMDTDECVEVFMANRKGVCAKHVWFVLMDKYSRR